MRLAVVDRAGLTHTGHERRVNEDAFLLREPLFMVADGVGGAQAGEVASALCAEAFAEVDLVAFRRERALREAAQLANRRIYERARADQNASGMGTTVAAALVDEDGSIAFANVGDSRSYLLRDGALQRLSEDHSLVGELLRAGQISEEEAEHHPHRNVITRSLGTGEQVEIDTFRVDGRDGDIVLLCSDGLTTMVAEADIGESLQRAPDAASAASDLVRLALAGGGEDNVTAVVFRLGPAREADARDDRATTRILPAHVHEPPREATRGRLSRLRLALGLLAGVLVLAALVVGAVAGLRASHFIGADVESGRVEIYQGVPVELYGDVKLYRPIYRSPVAYSVLDAATRARLFDHTLRSEDDARRVVRDLERRTP